MDPRSFSPRWLRTKPAAEYSGYAPQTFNRWRHEGIGPRFSRIGRTIVYDVADLDAFIASRKVATESQGVETATPSASGHAAA